MYLHTTLIAGELRLKPLQLPMTMEATADPQD